MDLPLLLLVTLVAALLGYLVGVRAQRPASARDLDVAATATSQAVAPVAESLNRFDTRLRDLEASRIEWHAQLREQVEAVRATGESLRRETAALATALRKPQVRGRWGELHLRRTAELAGMLDRCDFDLQVSTRTADNALLRPDMLVRLTGGRCIVVDAKVPLEAYLDLAEADDEDERAAHLRRHVRHVRTHVDQLSAKAYWRQFEHTPEFVVLFVPGESFLSAALEADPDLLEYASVKKIVLATPITLIALLRTVAFAWTQEHLADNAREILRTARELHDRIGVAAGHLDKLGGSLDRAVRSYNEAVASVETRVLVTARRLEDLHVGETPVIRPRIVESTPRAVTAAQRVDELRSGT